MYKRGNQLVHSEQTLCQLGELGNLPIGSGKPEEIQMMNNTVPYKKSCNYLCINLDSSLAFIHHID